MGPFEKGLQAAYRTLAHKLGFPVRSDVLIVEGWAFEVASGESRTIVMRAPYRYSGSRFVASVTGEQGVTVDFKDGEASFTVMNASLVTRDMGFVTYVPAVNKR